MTTQEIYNRLDIPKSLQDHMLRVAGLTLVLQSHWSEMKLDWEVVTQAALLHDVANVIKFDLERYPQLLGQDELPRIEYWREKQQELMQKYGNDEHAAADSMLSEIGVSDTVRAVIDSKTFGKAKELAGSDNMLSKILLYSDLRILPDGLGTLQARLEDVRLRLTKYSSRPDFPELVAACESIERTIQSSVDALLASFISAQAIDSYRDGLLGRSI